MAPVMESVPSRCTFSSLTALKLSFHHIYLNIYVVKSSLMPHSSVDLLINFHTIHVAALQNCCFHNKLIRYIDI